MERGDNIRYGILNAQDRQLEGRKLRGISQFHLINGESVQAQYMVQTNGETSIKGVIYRRTPGQVSRQELDPALKKLHHNIFLCVSLHPVGLILEPESIPVSEFPSCGANLRTRIYSCERETHHIQGLVDLFTLQGSGQAPLWYTPEKITVRKAWFTGSTCLALASSLEYILEVFLFYFSASFQSLFSSVIVYAAVHQRGGDVTNADMASQRADEKASAGDGVRSGEPLMN
ncbi:hypothetical protein EVAR_68871_1 [Eumeta japonica]|uniref:Uncharacterized protein n=1 Tax=Eumeta variegata TaxID=151549 RepID=A0A4C2AG58_EUMVA|nr:hypothetical protein EVAR_68871_1 [Eumeta japonica]